MNYLKEHFKTIQIIFMALLSGQIMFAAVVFFVLKPTETFYALNFGDTFTLLILVLSVASIIGSSVVFKLLIKNINPTESAVNKAVSYRMAKIVSWAISESVVMLSVVFFLVTGNTLFQLIFFILLIFFISKVPSKVKFIEEAKISGQELFNF